MREEKDAQVFSRKGQSSPLTEAPGSQVKSREAGYGEQVVTASLSLPEGQGALIGPVRGLPHA